MWRGEEWRNNGNLQDFLQTFATSLITRFKTIVRAFSLFLVPPQPVSHTLFHMHIAPLQTIVEIDSWGIGDLRSREWAAWRQNPSLDNVWIVAVRRTYSPDGTEVRYWPEVEIRF